MTSTLPPGFLFLVGALLIPFLQGRARKAFILLLPGAAFIDLLTMQHGTHWAANFLGQQLIFGQVDQWTMVFGYIFVINTFAGVLYALHLEKPDEHVATFVYSGSALGVVFAGDLLTVFIFWELMAFSSVYLIVARRTQRAQDSAFRYLLVHIFGGLALLGGIVVQITTTGSSAFQLMELEGLASWLIFIGFILNAAIPPLSAWLPDAYPEATVTGSVILSAFTTKTAVYVLARGFAGTELLIWVGVLMTLYGIVFAILENDMRRILAYSIINQVGFMIAGIGIGTVMSLNGTAAHAFCHILYKALLFMSAGSVLYMTGKSKCTDLGGLYRTMPLTMLFGVIGAASISAFPLTSGFTSKSLILQASGDEGMVIVWLMLVLASAGVFLHAGIKFPWFVFFAKDSGLRPQEPPMNMLVAMGFASFMCIVLGVFPNVLYSILPYPVDYVPYTVDHVVSQMQILMFSALAFFLLLGPLQRTKTISLDTDWFYRRGGHGFQWFADTPIVALETMIGGAYRFVVINATKQMATWSFAFDRHVMDRIVNGVAAMNSYGANSSAWIEKYVIYGGLNWTGYAYHIWARILKLLQTGMVHQYALIFLVGFIVLATLVLLWTWIYGPPTGNVFR